MKYNKGLASSVILLIIIGILAIAGIAYVIGKNSSSTSVVSDNSNYSPTTEQNYTPPAINNPPTQNPAPVNPPQQQKFVDLSTFSSSNLSPNYPPDPWPPVVQHNATPYSCSTITRDVFGTPTTLKGAQININNKTICKYSFTDGGAGSFSGVYTYITAGSNNKGTERVDFRASWHNCGMIGTGTTGDPQYDQCEKDQSTFFNNIDAYIASLM